MLYRVIDVIALSIPAVRDVETLPPDHDQAQKTPADAPDELPAPSEAAAAAATTMAGAERARRREHDPGHQR
jgi:hypothetical protein